MKIAHECPNSIFKRIDELTDYSYCLVHLYEENEQYRKHFQEAKAREREIILDNSIFELGTAFDSSKYAKIIQELQPTWYIVPDVLEDSRKTWFSYLHFIQQYSNLPGKRIGVIQGKTYKELLECYRKIVEAGVEKIAISFDYSYYLTLVDDLYNITVEEKYMKGRQAFLDLFLRSEEFLSNPKPIHLLGCFLPQEFCYYKEQDYFYLIDSLDTSNPVVHGLKEITYESFGLSKKESQKLFTLINSEVTPEQFDCIEYNIQLFKKFCND